MEGKGTCDARQWAGAMLTDLVLDDGVIRLRCLRGEDVGDKYLGWMHDPDVNQYLEIRHNLPTELSALTRFVVSVNESSDSILFGIFLGDGPHIGNIKLGPINRINKRAEIGLLLGDRLCWGKGYATRAIRLVSDFAFRDLGLLRLTAGMHEPNQGSFRAFLKAGYIHEGTFPGYWQSEGACISQLWLGLTSPQQASPLPRKNFGRLESLVFIGGGRLLLSMAVSARSRGFEVGAILAPRHASEIMANGKTLSAELEGFGIPTSVVENVADVDPESLGKKFASTLALCFGPAWIFPEVVCMRFAHGMLNFNGIPIPRYLGGAHYTWQILNGYRSAGCHIQQITTNVDRGDLLLSDTFELSTAASTPDDYFRENEAFSSRFLESFLDKLSAGADFHTRSFESVNHQRLYFPRLITAENGWIDWSWTGGQIDAFCRAFGSPYCGASTQYNGQRIYLQRTTFITEPAHPDFHPFCSGLIVRRQGDTFFVAVLGGLLRVDKFEFDEKCTKPSPIREGNRLFTGSKLLEQSRLYRPKISSSGNLEHTT